MNQNRCIFWANGDVLQMSIWYLGGGLRNSNLANITVFVCHRATPARVAAPR